MAPHQRDSAPRWMVSNKYFVEKDSLLDIEIKTNLIFSIHGKIHAFDHKNHDETALLFLLLS